MPLSDGNRRKSFGERLAHADLTDMLVQQYRPGALSADPGVNEDPGRFRNEAFFIHMYGDCQRGQVVPRLRAVRWMPKRGGGVVMVTTVNGVADHLEAVVKDLEQLPESMTTFLVPSSGTYSCRVIAGTVLRSMHAYAAAIDINSARSVLALAARSPGRDPISQSHPDRDSKNLRKARIHMGWKMVPFRHDAF
jgi:hypothetical protein